jgi:hypothetical protein
VRPGMGAGAQLFPCHGGANQQFTFDGGHLREVSTGMCLTATRAADGAPLEDAPLVVEPCDPGSAAQAWSVTDH